MIAIVNRGPMRAGPNGWRNYEVKINASVICRFRHKREDGLAVCLEKAALAVRTTIALSESNAANQASNKVR